MASKGFSSKIFVADDDDMGFSPSKKRKGKAKSKSSVPPASPLFSNKSGSPPAMKKAPAKKKAAPPPSKQSASKAPPTKKAPPMKKAPATKKRAGPAAKKAASFDDQGEDPFDEEPAVLPNLPSEVAKFNADHPVAEEAASGPSGLEGLANLADLEAAQPQVVSVAGSPDLQTDAADCDVYVSFRFAEAKAEAEALKAALEERGIKTFQLSSLAKANTRTIEKAIQACKVVVLLGTQTYGNRQTGSAADLAMIERHKKPALLVQMCDEFVQGFLDRAPVDGPSFRWTPGASTPVVPPELLEGIIGRVKQIEAGQAEVKPPPGPRTDLEQVSQTFSRLSDPESCVPLRTATVICIGGGGIGKTATRRSLLAKPFIAEHLSTVGGEQQHLIVMKKSDVMAGNEMSLGFKEVRDAKQTALAVLRLMKSGQSALEELGKLDRTALMELMSSDEVDELTKQEVARALELVRGTSTKHDARLDGDDTPGPGGDQSADDKGRDKLKSGDSSQAGSTAATGNGTAAARGVAEDKQGGKSKSSKPKADDILAASTASNTDEAVFTRDFEMMSQQLTGEDGSYSDGVHISFFDMGGQIEFSHLTAPFLRDHNIIVVYFRQDQMLQAAKKPSSKAHTQCLHELLAWLDVVVSTTSKGPVLLVGTYGDLVSADKDQKRISKFLHDLLRERQHPVLLRMPQNMLAKDGLIYFPVNNTLSSKDAGVQRLRAELQKQCEKCSTATTPVPSGLLRMYDRLVSINSKPAGGGDAGDAPTSREPVAHMTLSDLGRIYEECTGASLSGDLKDQTFRVYVDFLTVLGIITHSNVEWLDDLVIVDPLWFLQQATRIIRRPSLHRLDVDDRLPKGPMDTLYQRGILLPELLPLLWENLDMGLQKKLLRLMLQYGLIVALDMSNGGPEKRTGYVIPSMLPAVSPEQPPKGLSSLKASHGAEIVLACYSGSFPLLSSGMASQKVLRSRCHVPHGLFEAFCAELTRISQSGAQTSFSQPILSRQYASVTLGVVQVELALNRDTSAIQVRIHAANAIGLHQQIVSAFSRLLRFRFKFLRFETLVFFPPQKVYVSVPMLQRIVKQQSTGSVVVGQKTYPLSKLVGLYDPLLDIKRKSAIFHVFISYRHGDTDSPATTVFYNAISCHALGTAGERINTFWDMSEEDGVQIDEGFMQAMGRSVIVTPFVTASALQRMTNEASLSTIDHVLLEWTLALYLYDTEGFPVYKIIPVFCGSIGEDEAGNPRIGNLFEEFDREDLPDKPNMATYDRLCEFLTSRLKVDETKLPEPMSVRRTVERLFMMRASATLTWEVFEKSLDSRDRALLDLASSNEDDVHNAQAWLRVEVQRVFARCAERVVQVVEQTVSSHGDELNKTQEQTQQQPDVGATGIAKQPGRLNAGCTTDSAVAATQPASRDAAPPAQPTATRVPPVAPSGGSRHKGVPRTIAVRNPRVAKWDHNAVMSWLHTYTKLERLAPTFDDLDIQGTDLVEIADMSVEEVMELFECTKMNARRIKTAVVGVVDSVTVPV